MSMPHWLLRLYESLAALLLAIIAVGLVFLLSGCSTLQRERELRYMPEATNTTATRAVFATAYENAKSAAIADPSRDSILRMVDTGGALSAISCGAWMRKGVLAENGILMRDGTAAAAGAVTTAAAGALELSSSAVGWLGIVQMVMHLFGQVERTGLGVPDAYQTQARMRGSLGQCSSALIAKAKAGNLSLSEAIVGIDACEWICTPGAASTMATQALQQTEVVVQPDGALTTTAVTSSAVKDDAGARLRAYWRPNGVLDKAADARIRAWMRDNGIESSITMLANSELYAAARAKAVRDLGIGP